MREEKKNVLQSRGRDRGEEPCEVLAGGLAEEITALNGKKKVSTVVGDKRNSSPATYIYGRRFYGVSLSLIISKTTFPGVHLTLCLCHGWETFWLTGIFNFLEDPLRAALNN